MLTAGYLWRDRDGVVFLTPGEMELLGRSLRTLASAGPDVVVMDPGEGESECDALVALVRAGMVEQGQLTARGRAAAAAYRALT